MKKGSEFVFVLGIIMVLVIPYWLELNGFNRGQKFIRSDVYDISLNTSGTGTIEMCYRYVYHYPGYAGEGDIITYDFSTDPNHLIEVWLMDNDQFNHFHDTNELVGNWLITSASGAGICFPQYTSRWHIVFLHDEFQCTTLTYNITFSPYIVLFQPSSSTEVIPGSDLKITWESNILNEIFKIELFKSSTFITTIKSNTGNDGIEFWQIPEDLVNGNDYKIKITALTSGEFGFSQEFAITSQIIFVAQPYRDRVFFPHTTLKIEWWDTYTSDNVCIDLYLDSMWIKNIIDEVNAHDPYYWKVWQGFEYSNATYTRYQIRIQNLINPNYIGFSHYFTITNEKSMEILTPITNSSYSSGDSVNITWITDSPCSEVHIQLKKDGRTVHNITTTSNNGKFTWKVPTRFKTNSKYQIFVRAEDNSAWASSDFFKITQKIIPSYNLFILLGNIFLVSICIIVRKKLWNKI